MQTELGQPLVFKTDCKLDTHNVSVVLLPEFYLAKSITSTGLIKCLVYI